MATSRALPIPQTASPLDADRHDLLGLVLSAALPLAVFVVANGIAEFMGVLPLFFSPFGLPGWVGGAMHIGALPLFGIARWMVAGRGQAGHAAGWWVVALMAGMIAFPFIVMPLDSLQLSLVSLTLLLVGLAALARVSAISSRAALIMAPGLCWMGVSAFVGLTFAASWAPPFALTNAQTPAT